ncbi:maleylpyruvate isomerase N-terminal domain-containing protein [Actinoplanes sp. NEAU-A12]|uniref:Maleylpyruvate isomerase N-terminal domain-containing protein n=1 Tax=Actinoplanes sandaracinus TaxID=3045177 RepID=A0ABT6WMP2_9ACTN|nr:maleylpyruvate isomerase N-terminal domain-containing protein [Actinoplanes sandaracinus]MDI6100992.1 maleylpyruvate isomerase N-terminal domain-containing protein [Actinoplanes sandaracinus]
MDYRRTYRSAAIAFADLVSRIPAGALDGPGLGEWTLRDLLGHTVSSALRQVPTVLAAPAPLSPPAGSSNPAGPLSPAADPSNSAGGSLNPALDPLNAASSSLNTVSRPLNNASGPLITAPEGYFAVARTAPPEMVAAAVKASTDDARTTGAALGDQPATAVSAYIGRATTALAGAGDDDLVATPAGGMRVRDWLPTRTFELVVHGSDAAAAAGLPIDFDPDTLAEAAALAARIAAATGDGLSVLRALTGRATLPSAFSVV